MRSFFGKGVRSYSAKRVLEEIDYLYNDLGIKQFDVLDDDFSYDRKRTLGICNGQTSSACIFLGGKLKFAVSEERVSPLNCNGELAPPVPVLPVILSTLIVLM